MPYFCRKIPEPGGYFLSRFRFVGQTVGMEPKKYFAGQYAIVHWLSKCSSAAKVLLGQFFLLVNNTTCRSRP
jgi:hypothetical protein